MSDKGFSEIEKSILSKSDSVDSDQVVTSSITALINVLESKGIITGEEYLEELNSVLEREIGKQ